jgi:glucose-6-phosphate isomerase
MSTAFADAQRIAHLPLPYTQSIAGCLADRIGESGLTSAELAPWLERLVPQIHALQADYAERRLALLRVPEEEDDLAAAEAALGRLAVGARALVFFGTDGSSLGAQTLAQLGGWNVPGTADAAQKQRPRTRFYDTLDPTTLEAALASFDLASVRFIVVSKSGRTADTLVQVLAALAAVKAAGLETRIPQLFLGVTEAGDGERNGLRCLLAAHRIPMLAYHAGVAAPFAALTNVGALGAMARGLDARAVRAGARKVVDRLLAAREARGFAPAEGAAVAVALARARGIRTFAMLPNSDRLERFAHWHARLWSQTLGRAGEGTAAIACVGPRDPHGHLELFLEGPHAHLITLLRTPCAGVGPRMAPDAARLAGLDFLAGKSAGDLVAAQDEAVELALAEAGRPVRTLEVRRLDEAALGALIMHSMLETILAARLMGVEPFEQPVVERARALLNACIAAGAEV